MIRRQFLSALGLPPLGATSLLRQPRCDMLIRNGEVVGPARRQRKRAGVAIQDGKIAAMEASIPV